jgi:hypothetical protein
MENENGKPAAKAAESVREVVSQDGAVLLDIEQGLCFSMNAVGSKIWELMKKEYSIDEIADALEQQFHVPRAELVADISEFLKDLENKSLIQKKANGVRDRGFFSRFVQRRA